MIRKLQIPKTQLQEVLYELITKGKVSMMDFRFNSFNQRLYDLHELGVITKPPVTIKAVNKYGNKYTYKSHELAKKRVAKSIYKEICNR